MCKLVPVLRVIGFVFLVLAILAVVIGFVAPFWVRLPLEEAHGGGATTTAATAPPAAGDEQARAGASPGTTPATTPTTSGIGMAIVGDTLSGLLKNGSYEGLWAKCFHNFSCSCFWQNDFAMEKAFPGTQRRRY